MSAANVWKFGGGGRFEELWQSALGSYWHFVPWKPGLPETCKALGNAAGCVLHPPPRTTAPGRERLRASEHQGSLSLRLSSSLQGKTRGRIPMSVPVQTSGWRARPGPQAPGQKARSGCRRFHDPRVHSQSRRPGPALAARASPVRAQAHSKRPQVLSQLPGALPRAGPGSPWRPQPARPDPAPGTLLKTYKYSGTLL